MDVPETRYVDVGEAQVAYQTFGDGPDLVYSIGFLLSHVDHLWELPELARFLRRLGSFSRVTIFDRRGTGASDPLPASGVSLWEDWMHDLNAVLDAVGAKRPSLLASTDAGPMAMLFAASFPDRVASLILTNTGARATPAPDYPLGLPQHVLDTFTDVLEKEWGREDGSFPDFSWPARASDPEFRSWMARVQRAIATPKGAAKGALTYAAPCRSSKRRRFWSRRTSIWSRHRTSSISRSAYPTRSCSGCTATAPSDGSTTWTTT
jgi:pimeloyl-ACP methyl ester carboxylesterase